MEKAEGLPIPAVTPTRAPCLRTPDSALTRPGRSSSFTDGFGNVRMSTTPCSSFTRFCGVCGGVAGCSCGGCSGCDIKRSPAPASSSFTRFCGVCGGVAGCSCGGCSGCDIKRSPAPGAAGALAEKATAASRSSKTGSSKIPSSGSGIVELVVAPAPSPTLEPLPLVPPVVPPDTSPLMASLMASSRSMIAGRGALPRHRPSAAHPRTAKPRSVQTLPVLPRPA
mmetsp:Transcript_43400/g.136029  ORF Transcript_43400/g.136029 Transcript_43400/m.136029 type:complete len:224 (-) Transcript_43400:236-907(-)